MKQKIKTYKEYKISVVNKSLEKENPFSFEKIDERYYYVYRITNKELNTYYYGSRVSKIHPKEDLGVKYFSSSSNKEFKDNQKENPNNFKYKIIKIFDNTKDKEIYESYLHQYFNVKSNSKFYNKVNQTPFGHDTTGMVTCTDNEGNKHFLSKDEFHLNKDKYTSISAEVFKNNNRRNIGKKRNRDIVNKSTNTRIKNNSYSTGSKKAMTTRSIKQSNGKSIDEQNGLKIKESRLNNIDKNGLNSYDRAGVKISKTVSCNIWKETKGKEVQFKRRETVIKNGKSYNVYNKYDELIYENIPNCDLHKISQSLCTKTKDSPMKKSSNLVRLKKRVFYWVVL